VIEIDRLKQLVSYDADTGLFRWLVHRGTRGRSGNVAGNLNNKGYWRIPLDGRLYAAHRLAWFYVFGEWPKQNIDHINGIKTDSRIANLRDVSVSVNAQNQRRPMRHNKSGLLGVCQQDGWWVAQIKAAGNIRKLG
jgi:hypothetical protein